MQVYHRGFFLNFIWLIPKGVLSITHYHTWVPGHKQQRFLSADAIYVVVQFYPLFNFDFPLFDIHYHISIEKKQWKIKIESRIKLNYNIYIYI